MGAAMSSSLLMIASHMCLILVPKRARPCTTGASSDALDLHAEATARPCTRVPGTCLIQLSKRLHGLVQQTLVLIHPFSRIFFALAAATAPSGQARPPRIASGSTTES